MKEGLKAQAAVEFLLLLGVLSVVLAIAVNYYIGYNIHSNEALQKETYNSLCLQISNEMDKALSLGPIYERDFYLPAGSYSAAIENNEIIINYSGGQVVCYTRAGISETLAIGKNTVIYNGTELRIS